MKVEIVENKDKRMTIDELKQERFIGIKMTVGCFVTKYMCMGRTPGRVFLADDTVFERSFMSVFALDRDLEVMEFHIFDTAKDLFGWMSYNET